MVDMDSRALSCLVPAISKIGLKKFKSKVTFCYKECMADVDGIVNAESNGQYNINTGNDINGDVPEVEESNNVCEGKNHNQDDHDTDLEVAKKEKSNNEHTDHSQANVPPELIPDNLICFPSSVHFAVTECVRRVRRVNNLCDCGSGWNVCFRSFKCKIGNLELCSFDGWSFFVANQLLKSELEVWFIL